MTLYQHKELQRLPFYQLLYIVNVICPGVTRHRLASGSRIVRRDDVSLALFEFSSDPSLSRASS